MTAFLVDCHVHLNRYHEHEGEPTEDQVSRLLTAMDEAGIDHAVVLTSYKVTCDRPSVQDVLQILCDDPRTTVVEGLRWCGEERTDLFEMEARIRDGLVRGIKLYPGYEPYAINDPSLEAVYRMAAKHDVPVMVHTGDTYAKTAKVRNAHPLLLDDVAVDHPDVEFVMCHLGNPWLRDAAEVLYKNENVYADISGLTLGRFEHDFQRMMLKELRRMITYMGDPSRQLLFGTDWPLAEMGPYVKFLESLELSDDERACVAWRSANTLFDLGLDGPGAG